jgi:hypothetical protein
MFVARKTLMSIGGTFSSIERCGSQDRLYFLQ